MNTLLFPDAQIDAMAVLAKAALPTAINGRLEKAVRLVKSGSVELHEDGSAVVISETDGLTGYLVQHGKCTCEDFRFQPGEVQGWCAHAIARALVLRLQRHTITPPNGTQEPHADATEAEKGKKACVEASQDSDATLASFERKNGVSAPTVPPEYIVWIQNKPFVKFAGLLQMAHAQQLVELSESWTYNDAELSLAHSVAIFEDGRRFEGSGDASPSNVTKKVAPHFRRVALTRAKSRALRDALNIDMVAVEELGEID
jgi:hypothetical protein